MEMKEILKSERLKRNFTQEQLAKSLNITRAAYSMYELGTNVPPVDVLSRIADLYGVSVDYLIGRYSRQDKPLN